MHSRSKSGSSASSEKSDMTSAIKTSSIVTIKALSPSHTIHHACTKHIDIQYHFIRNCIEDGTTQLEYCPTEDMVADGLMKALGPERHRRLARLMGMGTWQKSEDYGLEITRISSGSDERTSYPVSPASGPVHTRTGSLEIG